MQIETEIKIKLNYVNKIKKKRHQVEYSIKIKPEGAEVRKHF